MQAVADDTSIEATAPSGKTEYKFATSEAVELTRVTDQHFKLDRGTVLLREDDRMQIDTPLGAVDFKPKAAALITVEQDITRVFDLYDSHIGCVQISVGKRNKMLSSGTEMSLVFATDPTEAQQIVLRDGIHRRQMKITSLGGQHFAVADECSIVDAMLKDPLLDRLHKSPEKADKRAYDKIIKTAAALLISNSEPYSLQK